MTKAAPSLNFPSAGESAEFAGVIAKSSMNLLNSAYADLTGVVSGLDVRHPLRWQLGEIGSALQSACDLNRQLIDRLDVVTPPRSVGPSSPIRLKAAKPGRVPNPAMVALIVESHGGLRTLMGEALRKQGYGVIEARNPAEAERIAAQSPHSVDWLITEILVAGASGVALGAKLQRLQPQLKIVYTVCEAHESVVPRECLCRATVLRKPFTIVSLTSALKGEVVL